MQYNVLIVEDNAFTAMNFQETLEDKGYGRNVLVASSSRMAKSLIDKNKFDIAFVDLDLEKERAGFDVVPFIKEKGIYTVILSGHDEDEYVEEGYDLNCDNYLVKPYQEVQIQKIFKDLSKHNTVIKSYREILRNSYISKEEFVIELLEGLDDYLLGEDVSLYIGGETGSGKTELAKSLHLAEFGNLDNYVQINCANMRKNFLRSELFGDKKGAHSTATSDKKGRILDAHNGTLHLDEIASLDQDTQAQLLTFLDTGIVQPLGGTKKDEVKVNTKIIVTCDKPLEDLVREGKFSKPLYYRLANKKISLPPLRKRRKDIKALIDNEISELNKSRIFKFSKSALEKLYNYNWYGNIRELKGFFNSIREGKGFVKVQDLPDYIVNNFNPNAKPKKTILTDDQLAYIDEKGLKIFIENITGEAVKHFYHQNGHKRNQTLAKLEITPYTFNKFIKKKKGNDE